MKIDESWYIKPKSKYFPSDTSAGGVVTRIENGEILIGLIRDVKFDDYLLPKGRLEKGENLEAAAKREIAEETGLDDIKLIAKLGFKERLTFDKNEWRKTHYFLFITEQKDGIQNLQDNEDYVFGWFPLDSLPKFFWPEQKELIESNLGKIRKLISEKEVNS